VSAARLNRRDFLEAAGGLTTGMAVTAFLEGTLSSEARLSRKPQRGSQVRVPGLDGGALRLGGDGGHVSLPAGMVWNNTQGNWLGRSQNPADPFLNGDIDDFRIYQRGLEAAELKAMVVPGLIDGLADYIAGQPIA
jgi:hypothetical protein